MSTCHAVRPCVLFPACFTGPGDWRSCDASRLDRGSEDSGLYSPDNSPFLRFSFPARLSPKSRHQGRLFISINFSTITSVILIRRPPHRERLRERSANWTERCWCFLHEFLDDAFAEMLPRKQRLQRFQSVRRHSRTIAQEVLVLRENPPSQRVVDFSIRPSLCCARSNRSPLTTKFGRKILESTRIPSRCLRWSWSHFFFNITN